MPGAIAFQGRPGAYSDIACRFLFQDRETLACRDFQTTLQAVLSGEAAFAVIPVENSIAGRVADIHHLLPETDLYIIAEHFQPVRHMLLGIPGSSSNELCEVRSHVHALAQCRGLLQRLAVTAYTSPDTAGAAEEVAKLGDPTIAAIASKLAGQLNGLTVLQESVEDEAENVTRFFVMSPKHMQPPYGSAARVMTSVLFSLRSVPASLYKALGGFATNGVDLTRLESYLFGPSGKGAQFFVDFEGHPEDDAVCRALDELRFFCHKVRIVGTYCCHPYRQIDRVEQSTPDLSS